MVTNPRPLEELLAKMRSQRVDIAGVYNSEGTYLGYGIETGLFNALWPQNQLYAAPAMSFAASHTDDTAVDSQIGPNYGQGGVEYYMTSNGNGTTWTAAKAERATAPAAQRAIFDVTSLPASSYAPHFPLHCAAGLAGWVAYQIMNYTTRPNPIDISAALTATFWGSEYTTSGGSMAVVVRRGEGAFTTVHNFGTVSYAGTDGTTKKSEAAISADSGRASWGNVQFFAQTFTGKLFATWFRMCATNQTTGFAITPFFSRSSMSIYDMHESLVAFPEATWLHFFDVLTTYQGATLADHCAIFDIYEGSNFASESSVNAGAPDLSNASSPANYVWYVQEIVTLIQNYWVTSGRSASNIAFRVRASHPINDPFTESKVDQYRTALRNMDFSTYSRVTVCDMRRMRTNAMLMSATDSVDGTHLYFTGYIKTERDCHAAMRKRSGASIPTRMRVRPAGGVR
jgi:hypothetical protein